jgi:hypothetical protein
VAGKARQVGGFSWWSARDVTEEEKDRKKFAIRWSVLKAKRRDGVRQGSLLGRIMFVEEYFKII